MNERREECGIRVGEMESEVLDVVADPGEGLYPERVGEGVCCEGEVSSEEESLGDQVAACRVGHSHGAYVLLG